MTTKQKDAAITHLRTCYKMIDLMEDRFGATSKQHSRALAMFYGACDMVQALYGEKAEEEIREKAITSAY